jgi:hypothetical protein
VTASGPETVTSIGGEPLEPGVDLVRIAARGLLAGILTGIGAATLVLTLVRYLLRNAPASDVPDAGAPFYLLVIGTMAAMAIGGAVAYRALGAIRSPFRRGIFSLIAAFATFVGALVATPVHYFLGTAGLLAFGALAGGTGLALSRRR